jgi:hypothetical protein
MGVSHCLVRKSSHGGALDTFDLLLPDGKNLLLRKIPRFQLGLDVGFIGLLAAPWRSNCERRQSKIKNHDHERGPNAGMLVAPSPATGFPPRPQ